MNKEIQDWIADSHEAKSMFVSAVGMMMAMLAKRAGDPALIKNADLRETTGEAIAHMLKSVRLDDTSWPFVKGDLLYDDYVALRKANGRLSEYDLVRPGLFERDFTSMFEYFNHYQRVIEHKKKMEGIGNATEKVCSKCGLSKSLSSFRSGAVCNSCRNRTYRQNVADRKQKELAEEWAAKQEKLYQVNVEKEGNES